MSIIDSDGLDDERLGYLAQALSPDRPMLFVGTDEHRLAGLSRDADGYLVKPVSARGLVACVKSTLSRAWDRYATSGPMAFGRYVFEPHGRSVLVGGRRVSLTQKEFQLALLLFRNVARPVSRVYIAGTVWRHDERINVRTMTAHISAIRSKLQLRADADYALSPIYNYGYRLDPVRRNRLPAARQAMPLVPVGVPG